METNKEKVNYKTVLVSAAVSLLMCIIVGCVVAAFVINRTSDKPEEIKYEEGDTLPSGAEATETKGGTTSLTLEDGTVVTYKIPDNMYTITADYLALVKSAYGMTEPVASSNLIVLGNENSVYAAKTAITATTFSDIYAIYGQIYGDEWESVQMSDIYSPAYQFIESGEMPETPYLNYQLTELDSITNGDITYRVLKQEYDVTDTVQDDDTEETKEITEHVVQVAAYSDTTDVIEIIVDEENSDVDKAVKILNTFIMG